MICESNTQRDEIVPQQPDRCEHMPPAFMGQAYLEWDFKRGQEMVIRCFFILFNSGLWIKWRAKPLACSLPTRPLQTEHKSDDTSLKVAAHSSVLDKGRGFFKLFVEFCI